MVSESWFRSLWKIPKKKESGNEKEVVGVLAFEIASLMSKLVHLWQSLSDKQVYRLGDEITNSVGIRKLVSEDDDFVVHLIWAEMIDSLVHVAKSVARLGKKCTDPTLKSFELVFEELIKLGADPYNWVFTWKKMDKKVRKMEHLISANVTLYQEMEMLSDLEQTVAKMKSNDPEPENLLEYQKKFVWKKQEVKSLKEMSLWNRSYDYVVTLLVRSLFTIHSRINVVFGLNMMVHSGNSKMLHSNHVTQRQSVSALLNSSVHQPKNSRIPRFASGPLGRFTTKSGPIEKASKTNNFYSGPLDNSKAKSGSIFGKNRNVNFFSGPLGRSAAAKFGAISGFKNSKNKMWQVLQSPVYSAKKSQSKPNRLTQVGPFKGCMATTDGSLVGDCYVSSTNLRSELLNGCKEDISDILPLGTSCSSSIFSSQRPKFLRSIKETLGDAALALHYANVIVVIEKLAASPHLIGHDARDDLYTMLPASVRASLRESLKPYAKSLGSSVYDTVLAREWTEQMASILEWLAPLAHNMIRWQSERSFEQQNFISRTNVLLVQTLYFANQEKTEAAITELLVGLNYIWRYGRELNTKALEECASSRVIDEYLQADE